MARSIHIFKTLKEQESFHKEISLQSSVADRFLKLYQMQQFNRLLHPVKKGQRKIVIR